MPLDLGALLDQLEEWLEAQVPPNISELPGKMLETVERVSNELMETLTMHGPPSISIPFPPFKDAPPPPPPVPTISLTNNVTKACHRATSCAARHPLVVAAGSALAITATVGAVGLMTGYGPFAPYGQQWRLRRKFGTRGVVQDGMLKEAIVLLSPSPTPPLLVPLAASLLKAGYVVVIAVPLVREAESIERRLSGLNEKSALRVLIYDPEDATTFPPFHRSLLATLTLRFPAHASGEKYPAGDPYNPLPAHIPHIHTFVSLYPLNPSPPSQPGALPALPTLIAPGPNGKTPMLVTLYPSTAVLTLPDAFASQVLTTNHRLLGDNLQTASGARVVSVFLGQINLPSLPAIISDSRALSRRELARQRLRESTNSATATFSLLRDVVFGSVVGVYNTVVGILGIGAASRDYSTFEARLLRVLKKSCGSSYYIGERSWYPRLLSVLPPRALPSTLAVLPRPPPETGPAPAPPSKALSAARSTSTTPRSASSSDHEGGEDLASSIHTTGTNQSSADSSGLEGSWVGLEAQ